MIVFFFFPLPFLSFPVFFFRQLKSGSSAKHSFRANSSHVPFWGRTTPIPSSLSPRRDCSTERGKCLVFLVSVYFSASFFLLWTEKLKPEVCPGPFRSAPSGRHLFFWESEGGGEAFWFLDFWFLIFYPWFIYFLYIYIYVCTFFRRVFVWRNRRKPGVFCLFMQVKASTKRQTGFWWKRSDFLVSNPDFCSFVSDVTDPDGFFIFRNWGVRVSSFFIFSYLFMFSFRRGSSRPTFRVKS